MYWTLFGSQARKERRLSYKCAGLSHLWDIHFKPRHVLGAIILPFTVVLIHSSCTSLSPSFHLFSLALSLSSRPSFNVSCILLLQVDLW